MKIIMACLFLSLLAMASRAQFSEIEKDFMQFEQTHSDSLTQDMYLDSSFCSKYNLKNITQNFHRMNVWQSPLGTDAKNFIRVCDIRWKFSSPSEAVAFHKKYLQVNAEFGEEIKLSDSLIDKVTDIRIFRENEQSRKMMEGFGNPGHFYYFIFVIDNCVAKVFVNTKSTVTADQATVFAKEAALRLNAYAKRK